MPRLVGLQAIGSLGQRQARPCTEKFSQVTLPRRSIGRPHFRRAARRPTAKRQPFAGALPINPALRNDPVKRERFRRHRHRYGAAARAYRRRQPEGAVGDQQEPGAGGRLFQGLQQRIGRSRVHRVSRCHQNDLLAAAVDEVLLAAFDDVIARRMLPHEIARTVKSIGREGALVVLRRAVIAAQRIRAAAAELTHLSGWNDGVVLV